MLSLPLGGDVLTPTRRQNETLMIGEDITVTVLGMKGNSSAPWHQWLKDVPHASRRDLGADLC